MLILDGKLVANTIETKLADQIAQSGKSPKLVIIQVGDNPASNIYVNMKIKFGNRIGAQVHVQKFSQDVTQETVLEMINFCNTDYEVNGIIVQLPLPKNLDKTLLANAILPEKDVDGLSAINMAKLVEGDNSGNIPATPKGILTLLKYYKIELDGKNIVVVGRSQLVGLPLSILLVKNSATVTIAHSHTKNLKDVCKQAEILITAVGQPKMFNREYVGENAIVVDVGISKVGDKGVGDVDFENVEGIVSNISPVPGGVGPMTVASLFENLIKNI